MKQLSKSYGKGLPPAVDEVSFKVLDGGITALLGPSGGGKTTLLRLIAGLETPSAGEVHLAGQRVDHLPPQKREIGFVFQNYALFMHMTVFENIAFGLRMKKWTKSAIHDRVNELMGVTGIAGLEMRYPSQLSGGQQQRVAFARALAAKPRLLLLDEPFAAVDAQIRKELRLWLRQLHDEIPVTSLFVTHDQQEALELADQVAVIQQGRLEQLGRPQEIYEHPVTAFVARFMGDANWLSAEVSQGTAVAGEWSFPAPQWPDGTRVDLLIRPEDVEIKLCSGEECDQREVGQSYCLGQVQSLTFLGQGFRVVLRLDNGMLLTALLTNEKGATLQRGHSVLVGVQKGRVFLGESPHNR
ncbi:ABC transporter ATP-binding protein [Heliomicrobium gestii]|uniref:ABC transporter ATP-binding protein n=1 Tax=Heliomicrobium gestii TaxID=2699 RepID=UPI002E2C4AD5|nr:ABC transporter ATP-binding protein [Heliomicrobium gestii]